MKKGFTLIELLAVILIISLLAVLAIPNVFKASKDVKKDLYCEKIDLILSTATRWGDDHKSSLKTNCYCEYSINDMVTSGKLKNEAGKGGDPLVENPYNSKNMVDEASKVRVYIQNNRAQAIFVTGSSEVSPYSGATTCENMSNAGPTVSCGSTCIRMY